MAANPVKNWMELLDYEISLDPEDWGVSESKGHELITEMVAYLKSIGEKPVWTKPPPGLMDSIKENWNEAPKDLNQIYSLFRDFILPYPSGNIHPRFWSWVQGTGSITAAYADFLASVMNSNVTIGDHAAMYIDQQVIRWFNELMGFDLAQASGILLSGGSMANITGLLIARNSFDPSIRAEGIQNRVKPLVFYASDETHSCQQKAAEILGLGVKSLHRVSVNAEYEMDTDALIEAIESDIQDGKDPFCIVANVGTVNTGAIDPIKKISDICKKYKLWLHIDGAFGALVKLLPEYHDQVNDMALADSIAFDLHKWMYLPYEAGCLLVKDKTKHRNAFAQQPNYLIMHDRGLSSGPEPIGNFGMELSRGFKALKIWFCLQEHGRKKYTDLIRQNIAQCLYLADKIKLHSALELMAPVSMNIVCFRYVREGLNLTQLNTINKEILMQLHERAIATPSYTILDGQYVIRVAHVNHRTKKTDFDALIAGVVEIGEGL